MSESGIAVLTYCPKGVTDHMAAVKSAYCGLYGYDFIIDENCGMPGRAPNWGKVNCVFRYFGKYDWVMYVDVNVGFANFTKPIERLVNDLAKGRDALFCCPGTGLPETGAFLVRNCRSTISFLKSWLSEQTFERWDGGNYHERWALNELVKSQFRNMVGLVKPLRMFNSRKHALRNVLDEQYVAGDFIIDGRGSKGIEGDAAEILNRNADFVSGMLKVAKVELEKSNLREIRRKAGGCPMIFRKPIELKPEPEGESVKIDKIENKTLENKTPERHQNSSYVEIKMDNGDEKVSIFTTSKSISSSGARNSSGIGFKKNGWSFSYPEL